jgi:hypothetical protein
MTVRPWAKGYMEPRTGPGVGRPIALDKRNGARGEPRGSPLLYFQALAARVKLFLTAFAPRQRAGSVVVLPECALW